ncbi:ABC transporter substrate-binding protein [Roseixanthobacter pseudopolyaromaticivorans]|uniref:ABC transporter substrate-binding protein n=1 Tax=Xanthobacteraceae TaxID=335928 RepID=UPI003728C459
MRVVQNLIAAAIGASLLFSPTLAAAQQVVRIGQATSALSFMPLWAARALDSYAAQGLTLTTAVVPGGDPSALAALDAGDIDLAAVGSEAVLRAAAKGQPFQIVYSLMSKVTLQLVVSNELMQRTGVKPSDPVEKRLAALKGALVGVSSIGGAQDTAARWLAAKGGLDPKTDIKVAQVGNPPALRAALENKRIDAFVLSPPEGYLAEKSGAGTVLVSLGDEFPLLAHQPFLVLVAKKPVDAKTTDLIVRTVKVMQAASTALVQKPEPTALAIQSQFFTKAEPDSIVAGVKAMSSGVADGGRLDVQSFQNLLTFAKEVGTDFGKEFDAKGSENDLWTNSFIDKAK